MAGGQAWRINQSAEDVFRSIDKRLGAQERRASPMSARDSLGPGMSARAIQILDWNSEEATFNGYFWSIPGALHSPDPLVQWTGHVVAKDDGSGLQQVWNVDPEGVITWMRTWVPTESDGTVVFTEWKRFATSSGLIGTPEIDQPVLDNIQQGIDDAAEAFEWAIASNRTFYQDEPPVSDENYTLRVNDQWFDTNDGNSIHLWSGTAWVGADNALFGDLAAALLAAQADATQALADAATANTNAGTANSAAIAAQASATTANNAITVLNATTIPGLQDDITANADSITTITGTTIPGLNSQISANAAAITTINNTTIPGLQGQINTNASAITTLNNTTIPGINSQLSSQAAQITTINGDITGLEGRFPIVGVDISDDAISAEHISANAINGMTITGTILQTHAAANTGLKFTTTGMVAYNASNAPTFTLLASDGSITMAGPLVTGGTFTSPLVQTHTGATTGVKFSSTGIAAYNAGGAATFSMLASDGSISMTGPLVTGGTLTGPLVQTHTGATTGVKFSSAGITAYGAGVPTFTMLSADGSIAMSGPIVTGGTFTSPLIQTHTAANTGLKLSSTGLAAYNAGVATFSLLSSDGSISMTGPIVTGGTITGPTVQTHTAANTGLKFTSSGLVAYPSGGGAATFTLLSSDGSIAMTGPILTGGGITGATVTGGVVQTETTAARGLKMTSAGLTAYTDGTLPGGPVAGTPTFTVTASTGAVAMLGTLQSGSTISGASLTGVLQTSAAADTGVKISNSGIYVYNTSNQLVMSALNSGGGYFAGSLASGVSISSPIITGGTYQTTDVMVDGNPTGVKINSTGIVGYNAAGTAKFVLNATTGAITSADITGGNITGVTVKTGSGDDYISLDATLNQIKFVDAGVQTGYITSASYSDQRWLTLKSGSNSVGINSSSGIGFQGNVTASNNLTVTGTLTASGALTVSGALTANGGLGVSGALTANAPTFTGTTDLVDVDISGSISGMGRKMNKWDFGVKSGNTDANGDIVVTNVNAGTSDVIILTSNSATGDIYKVQSQGTGTFTVRVVHRSGSIPGTANFYWLAIKAGT